MGAFERTVRHAIAVPLILLGLVLSTISEWLVLAGAWLADVET